MRNTDRRIGVVDGFRCIAILAVIGYHYTVRYSTTITGVDDPVGKYNSIFEFGYFGVQFFFVISGFVVSQTLERSSGFGQFAVKRLIRLWPSLILCSLLTFLVVKFLDPDFHLKFIHSKSIFDFIPSWTFTPPALWVTVLGRSDIAYIDGAYWSLFVEVIFYFFGGVIFFMDPSSFLTNWLRITLVFTAIRIITSPRLLFLFPDAVNNVFGGIYSVYLTLHISYWIYFALGIFFHSLFKKEKILRSSIFIVSVLSLLELYFLHNIVLRLLFVAIIGVFMVFVYRANWLKVLEMNVFVWIGLISYPLYLLHENIGLVLIHIINERMVHRLSPISPLIVTFIMIVLSAVIYRYYEKPAMSFLKKRFIKLDA